MLSASKDRSRAIDFCLEICQWFANMNASDSGRLRGGSEVNRILPYSENLSCRSESVYVISQLEWQLSIGVGWRWGQYRFFFQRLSAAIACHKIVVIFKSLHINGKSSASAWLEKYGVLQMYGLKTHQSCWSAQWVRSTWQRLGFIRKSHLPYFFNIL